MSEQTIKRISGPYMPDQVKANYLWHVMPSWKLKAFLDGGLWLARLDQFNDSLEGQLPKPNLGLLNKLPRVQVPAVLREYELNVKRTYASCWHMSDNDPSDYAWNTFGHLGLRTTPELMRKAFAGISGRDGPVHFGKVRYIDHLADMIPEGNTIEASFVVRREFEQENEARVLIHAHGNAVAEHLYDKSGPYGSLVTTQAPIQSDSGKHEFIGGHNSGMAIVVPINPSEFIEEVMINQATPDHIKKEVCKALERAGLQGKLRAH